jgi:hypothetical protein
MNRPPFFRTAGTLFFLASMLATPVATANNYSLSFNGIGDHVTFGVAPGLGGTAFTIETRFLRAGGGAAASTGTGGVTAIPLVMEAPWTCIISWESAAPTTSSWRISRRVRAAPRPA